MSAVRTEPLGHPGDQAQPDAVGRQARPVLVRGARGGRRVCGRCGRLWPWSHGMEGGAGITASVARLNAATGYMHGRLGHWIPLNWEPAVP